MHKSRSNSKQIFVDFIAGGHLEIQYGVKIKYLVDCVELSVAENIIFDTKMKVLACPEYLQFLQINGRHLESNMWPTGPYSEYVTTFFSLIVTAKIVSIKVFKIRFS